MKKMFKKLILCALIIFSVFMGVSCTKKKLTITFETNGGSSVAEMKVAEKNIADISIPETKKEGYTFAGWYVDIDLSEEYDEDDLKEAIESGKITLYAGWNKNTDPDIVLPSSELSLKVGEKLDLLAGVTAVGYFSDDQTANIKVNHQIPVDANGLATTSGVYNVKYSVTYEGEVIAQVFRTVEVIYQKPVGDGIISNGDFETGSVDPFTKTEVDGGAANYTVVTDAKGNKVLKVEIVSITWNGMAFPRIEQKELTLVNDKFYEVKFKAYAEVARTMHVQLGELIDQAPWFINIDPTTRLFDLGTAMQEYSFRFKPDVKGNPNLTNISLTFEFGGMPNNMSAVTTCYLDDISITEVDSLGEDKIAPTLTVTGLNKLYTGKEFDALKCVSVSDDQDENPKVEIVEGESKVPVLVDGKLSEVGKYSIKYKATDATGNVSYIVYDFEVVAPAGAGSELLKNNDFSDTKATSDGFTSWVVYGDSGNKLLYAFENGKLKLTVNNNASTANWNPQFKQNNLEIIEGKNYEIVLVVTSSIAREIEIGVQNDQWWNFHVDKTYSLEANKQTEIKVIFTAVAPAPNTLFFIGLGKLNDVVYPNDHTLLIEKISLKETTEAAKDETAPVITVSGSNAYYVNDAFELNCATATDAVDGKVEVVIDEEKSTLPVLVDGLLKDAGKYEIVFTAKDKAGNVGTFTYKFTVFEKVVEENLFGTPETEIKVGSTASEDACKATNKVFHVFVDDQGWGGAATSATATYENGILKVDTVQGGAWWGVQVFYQTLPLEAGSYIVSFNFKSAVAGNIKFNTTEPFAIVAGDNKVEAEFKLNAQGTYMFSLQFGTESSGGALPSGSYELSNFSIKVKKDAEENLFGTPETEIKVGSTASEDACKATNKVFHVFVDDQGWGGAATSATATYENGILKVDTVQGGAWWGVQVFYQTLPLEAGSYIVSFNFKSAVAGNIKFNTTEPFAIVAGDNKIEAGFKLNAQGTYMFSLQFGTESSGGALPSGSYELSNFSIKKGELEVGDITLKAPNGVVVNKLPDITPDTYIVAFAAADNAVKYEVHVYKNDTFIEKYEIDNGGRIKVPTEAGEYKYYVKSIGNGSNIKDSELSVTFGTLTIN